MNCAECQTEPLTPEHYCPCCGRKLSLQERQVKEPAPAATRCLSCGAMSTDGNLCKSCQHSFAPVLGSARVTTPSNESATARAQKSPTIVKTTTVAVPAVKTIVATPTKVVETLSTEAFTTDSAKAVADMTAKAHLAKAANPPPVTRRPIVPPAPQTRSRRPLLVAAVAVIVVAIGAAEGARRLGFQWPAAAAPEGQLVQATPAQESVTTVDRSPMSSVPDSAAKMAGETRASAVGPTLVVVPRKPPTRGEQPKVVRQTNSSNEHVAPVVATAPAAETPGPATRPPLPAVLAQAALAPPTGRFFERNDVDQSPQIATRVEPRLPANLSARAQNDVVVVRVLVSRTGHPFRINLLRGSRLGRSADDAVVAAVTQWTFSPAMKRGEPVNCWYNIGVPLGRAN